MKSRLAAALLAAVFLHAPAWAEEVTVVSDVYTVDRLYRSMMGPYSTVTVDLGEGSPEPELLWIRGYKAVMVGADGETAMPQDFMCHSNLDLADVTAHAERMGQRAIMNGRLFTLSQGQFEIRFPEGFGIPLMSDEVLHLTTQVLNLNDASGKPVQVRHKVSLDYVRDRDLEAPLKPLLSGSAYGLASLGGDDPYFGMEMPDPNKHGPGCLAAPAASDHTYRDHRGRQFTGHWVVPPGRQENRTLVTRLMDLPYDTTVHCIAVHLHPFAESLELRDLTTGETIFKSRARNFEGRIGLQHVDSLSSVEGIPLYQDHDYEIVSVYDNPTQQPQDSMAVMYLYLLDQDYGR